MNSVQILLGAEGIKLAYELSLENRVLDIQCLSQNYGKVIGDSFDRDYYPRLMKSGIKTREIVSDDGNDESKNNDRNKFRYSKKVSESDLLIGDNWVTMISYNLKTPIAVVIRNKEIIDNLRSLFEEAWKGL